VRLVELRFTGDFADRSDLIFAFARCLARSLAGAAVSLAKCGELIARSLTIKDRIEKLNVLYNEQCWKHSKDLAEVAQHVSAIRSAPSAGEHVLQLDVPEERDLAEIPVVADRDAQPLLISFIDSSALTKSGVDALVWLCRARADGKIISIFRGALPSPHLVAIAESGISSTVRGRCHDLPGIHEPRRPDHAASAAAARERGAVAAHCPRAVDAAQDLQRLVAEEEQSRSAESLSPDVFGAAMAFFSGSHDRAFVLLGRR
jgi:hypothetical protein